MKYLILFTFFGAMFSSSVAQQIRIDREVTMLALGDSYTIGQNVATEERWPHQFIDQLRALGIVAEYPDYIATTGWTTTRLIQGLNTMLNIEKNYNLVSILIGVNNQYQGVDVSLFEPDLRKLIERSLNLVAQDTSRVFILSIPDYAYTTYGGGSAHISREIDELNSIKKRLAAEYQVAFVDITPISRRGLDDPSLVAGDGLHPSGKQYKEWVEAIMPRLDLDQTLSITEKQIAREDQVQVYPNPAGSILFVDSPLSIDRIRLTNSAGILVHDQAIHSLPAQIDLSRFAPGRYTLWASISKSEGQQFFKPIIVSGDPLKE